MKLSHYIDPDLLSFDRICDMLREGKHFSLARYGDGEFNAILGKPGANCDGHPYIPEMGRDLARTLRGAQQYYLALHQSGKIEKETVSWLSRNSVGRLFAQNCVFHLATRDGYIGRMWEALEGKKVCIVGPEYLRNQTVIVADRFLPIPGQDTYTFMNLIRMALSEYDATGWVYLFCASMCAPLLVDHMYQTYGCRATFIDFGSTLDPYCGRKTRSFHKATV